ncbi:DUF6685 family protein (plasmid) [Aliarcobacter lanthieri]|uniref:DUF6685 family protein n=1 Tax=Aliarcobacter lanthieri TaxID=1355374 RepID=UPI003AAD468D
MKDFFITILKERFCFKENIREQLINIKFKEIDYKYITLNCFNSDDLRFFIDEKNKYFKDFFIRENFKENLNFLKIDSISTSKSKSAGYIFDTIYLFGKNVIIDRKDNWTYEDCIKHISKDSFTLCYYNWNKRYEWINSNGSHHFAAANFLATNNSYEQYFDCEIIKYSINKEVINKLFESYEMFVFNIPSYILKEVFKEDIQDIIYIKDNHIIVLFDKDKAKDKGYLNLLRLIDKKYILYFNEYLYSRLK